jgi:trans-aconitate 2-methyltransferase
LKGASLPRRVGEAHVAPGQRLVVADGEPSFLGVSLPTLERRDVDTPQPDWNASVYHRVSAPQTAWGSEVLERLTLSGSEAVLDAGCGTGKLTRLLAERLPQGRVVALDGSKDMLGVAARELASFGSRVELVQATLPDLPLKAPVDAVFSTATLHWVLDHPAVFRAFLKVTRPGGQLEFQCGGAGNLHRLHERAKALAQTKDFADAFQTFEEPWCYAGAEETAEQLRAAGWTAVYTWLEVRPTPFADAAAFSEFISSVNLRPFVAKLDAVRARRFTAALVEAFGRDDRPYVLDYVRLNASARAPEVSG